MNSKILIGLTSILLSFGLQAQHHQHSVGIHGMLMFGSGPFYLSHLPMFHDPHAAQVIVEAELDPMAQAKYLSSMASGTVKYHTLVPEAFDLLNMPKNFKGKIFAGHFERGGIMLADTSIKIKRVISFRDFKKVGAKPVQGRYLHFGNGKENFLAHAIYSKPDFDQIIRVSGVPLDMSWVTIIGHSNDKPLVAHKKMKIEAAKMTELGIELGESIYLEFDDLAH